MKIEIEFESSIDAAMKIDGKELKIAWRQGIWRVLGIPTESKDSFGEIASCALLGIVSDIMQAEAAASEIDSPSDPLDIWKPLSNAAYDAADDYF